MSQPRPRHVAVIMDGNRRWAASVGLSTNAGHRAGAETALALVDWCAGVGIRELTVWALSLENSSRLGGGGRHHLACRRGRARRDPGW